MTENELTILKEQIKKEIIVELQQNAKIKVPKPWDKIKENILPRLKNYDTYEQYQIITAISTIIRHTIGIRHIMYLNDEDMEKAKIIAEKVLDVMEENRGDKNA
jgi:ribosomal protein S30